MSVYGGATPQKTKQNKKLGGRLSHGPKTKHPPNFTKAAAAASRFCLCHNSIDRVKDLERGGGREGGEEKKTKSKSNTHKLHPRSLGAVGGEEVAFGLQRGEYFLQHPLRPVPEVLVLRPRVINHWDLFSCQYQQKDPGSQQRHLQ